MDIIETDPSVVASSERRGTVLIGENRRQVDFLVRYADRDELLIAADLPVDGDAAVCDTINTSASPIRFIPRAELVAARMWIDMPAPTRALR
ncbi:hypothetical protein P3T18_000083 [Paraburkholderia sp. GAS199]|uniref:hypothetical protein n=1 Tax=Paraburkholderia sp. GAS199 TaxID=3035126 RepID=UPI003D19F64D